MDIRFPLARFIYKIMAQYWTQASTTKPYTPNLKPFWNRVREGTKKIGENRRATNNALNVLIRHNVLSFYDEYRFLKGSKKLLMSGIPFILTRILLKKLFTPTKNGMS